MNFNEYQQKALETDTFDVGERAITSTAFFTKVLGLVGETGEIAEKFKKIYRDNNGEITKEQLDIMQKELGDVLWYIAVLADYLGIQLQDVAQTNIDKLASRKVRGVVGGSGDNR
jgi:NTP pyrophosphatase (non-canonical NTP hydrolase)